MQSYRPTLPLAANLSKNALINLGGESTIAQSEDFEGVSSSRETEYSVSPDVHKKVHFGQMDMLSEKSKKYRGIERRKRNITDSLREENNRAERVSGTSQP